MNMYAMKDCEYRDHQNSKTARRLNKRLICRRNRDLVKAKINSFPRSYQTLVHFSFKWVLVTSWSTICGMLSSIHSSIIGDSTKREQKNALISGVSNSLILTIWHLSCWNRYDILQQWIVTLGMWHLNSGIETKMTVRHLKHVSHDFPKHMHKYLFQAFFLNMKSKFWFDSAWIKIELIFRQWIEQEMTVKNICVIYSLVVFLVE